MAGFFFNQILGTTMKSRQQKTEIKSNQIWKFNSVLMKKIAIR